MVSTARVGRSVAGIIIIIGGKGSLQSQCSLHEDAKSPHELVVWSAPPHRVITN